MIIKSIKAALLVFLIALISVVAIKIIYINLTQGTYVKYGCCNYGYLTREGVEKEKMKINICPRIECKIEQSPGYKLHTLFNAMDYNK